ncbi:MAG: DUF1207 domain-containing protein [Alphaproteobacteria bacterium]|nr:DUF1207 domain-containing protein [Alphaproteobacteria bacterium]MBN2779739.1 DUF1207 domain-containing protein [Alphaproteobacteria bacterium]
MKKIFVLLMVFAMPVLSFEIVPEKVLFTPLMVDPAESRMSGMYGFYDMSHEGGLTLGNVGNVSIGSHRPFFGWGTQSTGQWQFGVDAAAKMQFMLDQPSLVLAQSDYSFGFDLAWKKNKWSSRIRAYHVSSHLGDEYMEATGFTRFQYNTEGFDMLVAYRPTDGLRFYAGGDYYFNIDPADIGTNMAHFGAEYIHPTPLFANTYFVMASDFKLYERNKYDFNTTAAMGFQFSKAFDDDRFIRLMLEGYTGSSPHTQFYYTETNYYGVTLQFGF